MLDSSAGKREPSRRRASGSTAAAPRGAAIARPQPGQHDRQGAAEQRAGMPERPLRPD